MVSPAGTGPVDRERRPRPLLRTTLGDVLRRTRLAQGRTLADVARAARVSLPYLSELERGRKEASSEILAAVCTALRVELADLLTETGRRLAGDPSRRLAGDPARQLAEARGRKPDRSTSGAVVRLDDIRGRGSQPAPHIPNGADIGDIAGPGPASIDAQCLLAA